MHDSTPDADASFRSFEERVSLTPEDDSSSDTPSPVASVMTDQDMEVDKMGMHMSMPNVTLSQNMEELGAGSRKRSAAMMMEDEDQFGQLRSIRGNSAVHTPHGTPRHLGIGMPPEPIGRSNTPILSLTTSSLKPRKYRLSSSALLTTLILMLPLTMTATPRFTGLVPWVEYALSSCFSLQARQSLLVIMPNKLLLCAASCFK